MTSLAKKPFLWLKLIIIPLLCAVVAVAWFGYNQSSQILEPFIHTPLNIAERGIQKNFFYFTGHDGARLRGCLVNANKQGIMSPRQSRIRDMLVAGAEHDIAHKLTPVIICTSWDKGIQTSLEYAECLAIAGYTCILWDPRYVKSSDAPNNSPAPDERAYCTYGKQESKDVPLLINAVGDMGINVSQVIALGQGFGASVLIMSAAEDERIRSLVAIDSFTSLNVALKRGFEEDYGKIPGLATYWLTDRFLSARAGYTAFEVAPISAALKLRIPIFFICTNQYFFSSLEDTLITYHALATEDKPLENQCIIFTPRSEHDAPQIRTKIHERRYLDRKQREQVDRFELHLYDTEDELMYYIINWIPEHTHLPLPSVLTPSAN